MSNMTAGFNELRGKLEEVVNLLALYVDITGSGVELSEPGRAALTEVGYSQVEQGLTAVSQLAQVSSLN